MVRARLRQKAAGAGCGHHLALKREELRREQDRREKDAGAIEEAEPFELDRNQRRDDGAQARDQASQLVCAVLPRNWRVMCQDSGADQRRPSEGRSSCARTEASSWITASAMGIAMKRRMTVVSDQWSGSGTGEGVKK